ncbi:MAG TPA: hypothetical protein VGK22_23350 [Candidatus Angelobacter sp.]|jgi:hypothetical protein
MKFALARMPHLPYRDAVVSYVDLLGFKALIDASDADPLKVEEITGLLRAARIKAELNTGVLTNQGIEPLVDTRIFSDLIVRTSFKRAEVGLPLHLRFELKTLARIQWEFIQFHNVLVRGGVSCQKMVIHQDYLFGPGLVRSYELEKTAIVPRIIIDSELVRLMEECSDQWWKDIRGRGEDGHYFVDYLNFQVRLGDDLTGTNLWNTQILIHHKAFLLREIGQWNTKPEAVRQKILWIALYHNETIDRLARDDGDMRVQLMRHKIDPQLIG